MADSCDVLCLDLPRAEELRRATIDGDRAERLAITAAAFGDPTRLAIAAALMEVDELCGCDLAWITSRPQNLVSHHLRALKERGLASSRRDGKLVMYSLTDTGVRLLSVLLKTEVTA